ncbi:hypothetical protein ACFQV4_29205 [Streptomyces thermocarboxydus]
MTAASAVPVVFVVFGTAGPDSVRTPRYESCPSSARRPASRGVPSSAGSWEMVSVRTVRPGSGRTAVSGTRRRTCSSGTERPSRVARARRPAVGSPPQGVPRPGSRAAG